MYKTLSRAFAAVAASACMLGLSSPAHAVFVATICNDIGCTGGDDFIVQDGTASDSVVAPGAISFSVSAFGYSIAVNTAQSKPMLGSATAPQLDVSFAATTGAAGGGNLFLYASDTDFLSDGAFALTLGGTSSGGSSTVTGRAWGGTSNTQLQFSGANLFGTLGPFATAAFSGSASGLFSATVNPYSLTIGVAISRMTAGTSSGNLNLQISPVPEPSTWALMLMGPVLLVFVARRRTRH